MNELCEQGIQYVSIGPLFATTVYTPQFCIIFILHWSLSTFLRFI